MAGVKWAEPALDELAVIAEYIALDKPDAAARFVARVLSCVARLERFPLSGKTPAELPRSGYREVVVPPCRIFYRVTDETVFVLHVMRSEKLLVPFLLDERGHV